MADLLTSCVYNARDIRDTRSHPGGTQYSFSLTTVNCETLTDQALEALDGVGVELPGCGQTFRKLVGAFRTTL